MIARVSHVYIEIPNNNKTAVLIEQWEKLCNGGGRVNAIWGTILEDQNIGKVENQWLRECLSLLKVYLGLRMNV